MRWLGYAALFWVQFVLWPMAGLAQTPQGMQRLALLPGAYALNASQITLQATIIAAATKPETLADLMRNFTLCADAEGTARRLRAARLRVVGVGQGQSYELMRAGRCQVYVTRRLDFGQLNQNPDQPGGGENPRPGGNGGDEFNPPQEVIDRTAPSIQPLQNPLRNYDRRVWVQARVEDKESAIEYVRLRLWNDRVVTMQKTDQRNVFAARIELPENYKEEIVVIESESKADKVARVRLQVARIPYCGLPQAVDPGLVRSVQTGLECVGYSPQGIDGFQGKNTCKAIERYLVGEMDAFNAGKISWQNLNARLKPDCENAKPVRLAFESPIEADANDVTAVIGLAEAGAAKLIELTPYGGAPQRRDWFGTPVSFSLEMPQPGQERTYTVTAYDVTGRVRDSQKLVLRRPEIVLRMTPDGIVDRNSETVSITAQLITGASAAGRIRASGEDIATQYKQLEADRATFTLPMPSPGNERKVTVAVLGRDGNWVMASRWLLLRRPEPELRQPDLPSGEPRQPRPGEADPLALDQRETVPPGRTPLPPQADQPDGESVPVAENTTPPVEAPKPILLSVEAVGGPITEEDRIILRIAVQNPGETKRIILTDQASGQVLIERNYVGPLVEEVVRMPGPGQSMVINVAARDGGNRALAGSQIAVARALAPAAPVFPLWGWILGLGVFVMGGLLGFRVRRVPTEEVATGTSAAAAVKPNVTVKADESPGVWLPSGALPAVVFWVDDTGPVTVEIEIEEPEE